MAKLPSEQLSIVATIDPDAYAASTTPYTSDYANMEFWHQAMGVVHVGTIASSGTVDFALVQATSSTGAGVKAITGKSITQITTGVGGSDCQAVINLKADELDVAGGFSFVAARMTIGTAAVDSGAVLYGVNPRFAPANDNDLASVTQIVT